jgi:hypothetical protein
MSPERAKVLVVEDSPDWVDFIEAELRRGGHQIIGICSNILEARRSVDEIRAVGGVIEVAVIDGHLGSWQRGELFAQYLGQVFPDTARIGYTSDPEGVGNVDKELPKTRKHGPLAEAITAMPYPYPRR